MNTKDFASIIANIHNRLIEVNVRGEDVLRMAEVLQICRNTVELITQEDAQPQEDEEEEQLSIGAYLARPR